MFSNTDDFKDKVRSLASPLESQAIRDCHGVSNSAKFIPGGFLCGIPNIDNLEAEVGALCIFSHIQLSPESELHTALLIRENFETLLEFLEDMRRRGQEGEKFFSDKNNNCALFLWSDGKAYPYNKAKSSFENGADILSRVGGGVEPDALYWAVYGDSSDAFSTTVKRLEPIVGKEKFLRVDPAAEEIADLLVNPPTVTSLDHLVGAFGLSCDAADLIVSRKLISRYVASLLSKRFLILTGLSGSGKTKVAQAFARWITEDPGFVDPKKQDAGKMRNPYYALVPVGADWIGTENIVGYPDGLCPPADGNPGRYITKEALDVILHAADPAHKDLPHFLILDEMNLSHVERYFADILSMIESGEQITLYCDERDENGCPKKTREIEPTLRLPGNLFIIGTVNVDETTYMFSPKVLDRANVLEFRVSDKEIKKFLSKPKVVSFDNLDGEGVRFGKSFVAEAKGDSAGLGNSDDNDKKRFDAEIELFYAILQAHGAEFGYRVVNEAFRFVSFYKNLVSGEVWGLDKSSGEWTLSATGRGGRDWIDHAIDAVVIQKILPKLHGSKVKLGQLLRKLYTACVEPRSDDPRDATARVVLNDVEKAGDLVEPDPNVPLNARFRKSAEKVYRMWRHLNENGFTSFPEN